MLAHRFGGGGVALLELPLTPTPQMGLQFIRREVQQTVGSALGERGNDLLRQGASGLLLRSLLPQGQCLRQACPVHIR